MFHVKHAMGVVKGAKKGAKPSAIFSSLFLPHGVHAVDVSRETCINNQELDNLTAEI
jgi:hypothetical protein